MSERKNCRMCLATGTTENHEAHTFYEDEPFFKAEDFKPIRRHGYEYDVTQENAARIANAKRDDELSRLRDENARLKEVAAAEVHRHTAIAKERNQLRELLKGAYAALRKYAPREGTITEALRVQKEFDGGISARAALAAIDASGLLGKDG